MAVVLDIREIQVQQVNGNDFKSTAGDWLNFSKFGKAEDLVTPHVGERIVVHLDKAGFVRKIEPVIDQEELRTNVVRNGTPAPASTTPEADRSSAGHNPPTIAQDDRGIVITRLAVLNTATAILSSGGGAATPEEVLELAGRLEAWATR